MGKNKWSRRHPSRKPKPLNLQSVQNYIATHCRELSLKDQVQELTNLLRRANREQAPNEKLLTLIENARVSALGKLAKQSRQFKKKFQFSGNPIGTRLKAIDNGFWAAVEKNNHSAATKSIIWAINFSKRAKCEKYCSEYLEHLARRLLNEFVKTETKEKTRKLILDNLFCVSLKEAIKLAKSSGTKADLNSMGYLLLRGYNLFKSNGL